MSRGWVSGSVQNDTKEPKPVENSWSQIALVAQADRNVRLVSACRKEAISMMAEHERCEPAPRLRQANLD